MGKRIILAMIVLASLAASCQRPVGIHPLCPTGVTATPTGATTFVPTTVTNLPTSIPTPADTATPTKTPTLTVTWTCATPPIHTWTPTLAITLATYTPTVTPTHTPVWTLTPTSTPTGTSTGITGFPTNTPTQIIMYPSATPTPTGCGKFCVSSISIPANPASAGGTVVGFRFDIGQPYGLCGKTITGISLATSITGNLATEILEVQLYGGGLGTAPYGMVITFTPNSCMSAIYEVRYVLSPTASGTIRTSLTGMQGYVTENGSSIHPLNGCSLSLDYYPVIGPILTVSP